ncbi:AfsR/SARP family transcriptional regulator [Kutzneria kofuensis]|uniref:AfsR/SARP family transcriptional regulator n=1 Tax=Kutzneria kofuensis TaxID=103725 RepID=UPI0031F0CA83
MGLVYFALLGSLELRVAGAPVALGGERQRKLLALLLLNAGSVLPYDRLVDELWEDPPPTARRQVANAATGVRRVIGQRLVTTPHGYLVRLGDDRLDLADFRDLVRTRRPSRRRWRRSCWAPHSACGVGRCWTASTLR